MLTKNEYSIQLEKTEKTTLELGRR